MKPQQKKYLRSLSHDRNVVIWIGQKGLTDAVLGEIDQALKHHELIKIKIRTGEKEMRDQIINRICEHASAQLIQTVGNIASVYRANPDKPVISLPA